MKEKKSFVAIDLLVEAMRGLRRQGALTVTAGDIFIEVPYMKRTEDGRLVRVNDLGDIFDAIRGDYK